MTPQQIFNLLRALMFVSVFGFLIHIIGAPLWLWVVAIVFYIITGTNVDKELEELSRTHEDKEDRKDDIKK